MSPPSMAAFAVFLVFLITRDCDAFVRTRSASLPFENSIRSGFLPLQADSRRLKTRPKTRPTCLSGRKSSSVLFAERGDESSRSSGTAPLFVASSLDPVSPEEPTNPSFLDNILSGYLGPRVVLAAVACVYGTNFPLGSIMADALPAPAVTSARMLIAALAMSPFVFRLEPALRRPAILTGCFTSMGYISQSLALVDTSPATVSFLGSAIVLVCPFLEWAIDKKPMSIQDAPQTWLAATLCLGGVGILELWNPAASGGGSVSASIGIGDLLALLQAVGFGTQVYLSEKMVRDQPDQALPVTATLVATTAFISCLWCLADGWMTHPGWEAFTLPNLFFEPSQRTVAMAVAWTALVSTALSFFIEMSALARVPSAEAAVIVSTEPMWAALFAAALLGESFGMNDYVGGSLIVLACLANTLKPSDFDRVFGKEGKVHVEEGAQ
jgi:drug/metabolite transporter (DMT)-like permease